MELVQIKSEGQRSKVGLLQFIKIENGIETLLEEIPIPDSFAEGTWLCSPEHIEKLEDHYKRTSKPKRTFIDAVYIIRRQIERSRRE